MAACCNPCLHLPDHRAADRGRRPPTRRSGVRASAAPLTDQRSTRLRLVRDAPCETPPSFLLLPLAIKTELACMALRFLVPELTPLSYAPLLQQFPLHPLTFQSTGRCILLEGRCNSAEEKPWRSQRMRGHPREGLHLVFAGQMSHLEALFL